MKKFIYTAATATFVSCVLLFTSCKKNDTTAPVITVTGGTTVYSSLNATYTDPGATATDDTDGDLTSKITVSGTVNKDLTGNYTLTYTATDAAGNVGTATRTVIVRNDAYVFEGTFSVKDSIDASTIYTYNQVVTSSTTINDKIMFSLFANYSGNSGIYANATPGTPPTNFTIPSQTATSIGSLSETHTFGGTGVKTTTGFKITYTDQNVTGGGTATGYATYTKQ